MKTEQGVVIDLTDDNVAKVKVGRHSECKNCGACPGDNSIIIDADNKIGAKIGQRVTFEVKEENVLKAAFIVFILPLISLLIGVILGGWISSSNGANIRLFQIGGGAIMFLLAIVLVKLYDKATAANKKTLPKIVGIL